MNINPQFAYIRLERGGKRPVDRWQGTSRAAITDVDQWIADGYNLGVRTGPLSLVFVVDVDVDKETRKASPEWRALMAEHGVPKTMMVKTPSGGIHFYFEWDRQLLVKNDQGLAICKGVDIRGGGGYVVAEGSTAYSSHTGTTGEYRRINDLPILPAPDWLLDKLRVREEQKKARQEHAVVSRASVAPKSATEGDYCDRMAREELNSLFARASQLTRLAHGERMDIFGERRGWEDGNGFFLLACRIIEITRWPKCSVTTDQAFEVWRRRVPPHYRSHVWQYALDAAESSWKYGDQQLEAEAVDSLFGF